MHKPNRFLLLLLVVLLAWLPVSAQLIVYDAKDWLPKQGRGAYVQVRMLSPQGVVIKGSVVSTGPDSFVLQQRKRTTFSHTPKPLTLSYADIEYAREYNPNLPEERMYKVFAVVAIAIAIPIAIFGVILFAGMISGKAHPLAV